MGNPSRVLPSQGTQTRSPSIRPPGVPGPGPSVHREGGWCPSSHPTSFPAAGRGGMRDAAPGPAAHPPLCPGGRSRPYGSSPFPAAGAGAPPAAAAAAAAAVRRGRRRAAEVHLLQPFPAPFVRAARSGASHPTEHQVSGAGAAAPPPSSPSPGLRGAAPAAETPVLPPPPPPSPSHPAPPPPLSPPGAGDGGDGDGGRGAAAGQVPPPRGGGRAGGPAGPGCAGMYPTMLRATCGIPPPRGGGGISANPPFPSLAAASRLRARRTGGGTGGEGVDPRARRALQAPPRAAAAARSRAGVAAMLGAAMEGAEGMEERWAAPGDEGGSGHPLPGGDPDQRPDHPRRENTVSPGEEGEGGSGGVWAGVGSDGARKVRASESGKTFPFPERRVPPGREAVRERGAPRVASLVFFPPEDRLEWRGANRIPPGIGRDGFCRGFLWVGRAGKEWGEEQEAHAKKKPLPPCLPAQGCFGEGGRVTVVCAVGGRSQQRSLSPSPSAAFHGGFLTRGVGVWLTKISQN